MVGKVAWGRNDFGQATVPASAQADVIAIAGGDYHTLALKRDGSVVAWGRNSEFQSSRPAAAASGVTAIAAGGYHSVALKNDGKVIAWGWNIAGQATAPMAAQSDVTAIAAGGFHSVALVIPSAPAITTSPLGRTMTAGQCVTFAVNATGYPLNYQWRKDGVNIPGATGPTLQLASASVSHSGTYTVVVSNTIASVTSTPPAALTVNAPPITSLVAWGWNEYGQTNVPAAAQGGIMEISAGGAYTVALKIDGSVVVSTTGTLTSRTRGQRPSAFNLIRVDDDTIVVQHLRWEEDLKRFKPSDEGRYGRILRR